MVEDAQTHFLPANPQALDNVAHLHGLADGAELIDLLSPHVERVGQIFDGLAPEERKQLSNDPDLLRSELAAIGFDDPPERRGTSRTGAQAKHGRSARLPRNRRLKRCFPPC